MDKWYYGVRTANTDRPENDLWVYYFTSSKYVKEIRLKHGEPDVIEIRREFIDPNKAALWESKVLTRLDVRHNEKWVNKSVNKYPDMSNPEIRKKISDRISQKKWITNGISNKYINKGDVVPDNWVYGRSGVGATKEWKQRLSEAQSKRKSSLATKKKMSESKKGEKNSFWGKKHKKESKDKMSEAQKKKWMIKATASYITPWGEYLSTPDAAKNAPFKVSAGSIWLFCCKYSNKTITARMTLSKHYPEFIGITFNEAGFTTKNII